MQSPDLKYVIVREAPGLTDRAILLVPVVNPEGTIKFVRVNEFIQSALISVSRRDNHKLQKGEVPAMDVVLKPGLEDKGWALLADLFHQDNMAPAWAAFQRWMLDSPMGTIGGEVKPFPTKYLPSGVALRKKKAASHQSSPADIVIPELDERKDRN